VEVLVSSVTTLLINSGVVDPELDDFTKTAAFLPVVYDNSNSSTLSAFNRLPKSKDEVWSTTANVTSKDVRPNALIMNAHDHFRLWIPQFASITKCVTCTTADSWDVGSYLWIQQAIIIGVFVQCFTQLLFC
jgi:hypothetical protein